jgi:nucleotidyltransferase substrate binding protein (TIGR01987 family)
MKKTKKFFEDFEKALGNLEKGIEVAKDDLAIDGVIKRFELCFELSWKLIKNFLEERGLICKSPRGCFKEAFLYGLLDDEEVWLEMIDDRNYLVHTYTFERSREIFEKIKTKYIKSFKYLYEKVKEELG